MLKIRLRRTGQKHQPSYRVVVADKDSPRDGRFVEILGHYNPRTEPVTFEVKEDRVRHWVSVGAQPTETVHRLLHARGILETEPPKRPTKPSRVEREAAAAAAKAAEDARLAAEAKAAADAKAAEEAAAAAATESEGDSTDDEKPAE